MYNLTNLGKNPVMISGALSGRPSYGFPRIPKP